MSTHERICPNCGEPVGSDYRFCPHCGAALRPADAPPRQRATPEPRRRVHIQGGMLLPGLYVPFGRQSPRAVRWGWLAALLLLLLGVGPLLLGLLFHGLSP